MNPKRFSTSLACAAALCFLAVACSGNKSSSTGAGPALDSLSDLPSVNASDYDYSLGAAVEGLTHSARTMTGPVGGFSRAACEGYTLKKQLFQDSRQVESFLCYIKSLDKADIGMTVPADSWSYYEIHFPDRGGSDNGPPPNVRVRIGKFASELEMDVCTPRDGVYSREVEMRFAASDTGYHGYVVNEYQFTNQDGAPVTGNSKIDVTITGNGVDAFTAADFSAYHRDDDGAGGGWMSQMNFTADAATTVNTLSGANSFKSAVWNSNGGKLYGQWGQDLIGSVKFSTTGEYPPPTEEQCLVWGMQPDFVKYCAGICRNQKGEETAPNDSGNCVFLNEGTESFDIDNTATPPSFAVIENAGSPYFTAVGAATLPDLTDIESRVAFVETWTCEGDFAAIDATALTGLKDTCEPTRDEEMWRMCEEQQQAANGKVR